MYKISLSRFIDSQWIVKVIKGIDSTISSDEPNDSTRIFSRFCLEQNKWLEVEAGWIISINTFIHSRSSLENHIYIPDQNWEKSMPVFRPKRRKKKKTYPLGRHITVCCNLQCCCGFLMLPPIMTPAERVTRSGRPGNPPRRVTPPIM